MKCSECDVELVPKKETITVEIPDKEQEKELAKFKLWQKKNKGKGIRDYFLSMGKFKEVDI